MNRPRNVTDGVIEELDECIEGDEKIPYHLNRRRSREILEDFVAAYNIGKVA